MQCHAQPHQLGRDGTRALARSLASDTISGAGNRIHNKKIRNPKIGTNLSSGQESTNIKKWP